MYCKNCGQELPEEGKFCINCGQIKMTPYEQHTNTFKHGNYIEKPQPSTSMGMKFHNFLKYYFVFFTIIFSISTFGYGVQLSEQGINLLNPYVAMAFSLEFIRIGMFYFSYKFLNEYKKNGIYLSIASFIYWSIINASSSLAYGIPTLISSILICISVSLLWIIPIYIYYKKRMHLFN